MPLCFQMHVGFDSSARFTRPLVTKRFLAWFKVILGSGLVCCVWHTSCVAAGVHMWVVGLFAAHYMALAAVSAQQSKRMPLCFKCMLGTTAVKGSPGCWLCPGSGQLVMFCARSSMKGRPLGARLLWPFGPTSLCHVTCVMCHV